MKNLDLRGAGAVFRYTVQQHYKNRSVIIFLLFLFVGALVVFPIRALIGGKSVTETAIKKVYLRNETGFMIEADDIRKDQVFSGVEIIETKDDDAALAKTISEDKTAAAAVMTIDQEKMRFDIRTNYGADSDVKGGDADALNEVLSSALHQSLLRMQSVTAEQEALLHSKTYSQVSRVSDYLRNAEETGTDTHVFANLFYCYLIIMLNTLAMSYVFQQCMEEKVSKLVESLLVSVSPAALMLGKLLAVTLFIFGGLGLVALGLFLSFQIGSRMTDPTVLTDMVSGLFNVDFTKLHISGATIALFLLCTVLAYAIAASFSAIVGSCCSRTEDTQQASLAVVLFIMIGYLVGAMVPMFENDAAYNIVSLFPLTSIFSAFPNFVCGKISAGVFTVGLLLQAVTVYFLIKTAGRVYRMMIFYRSAFPKPKQVIRMLREEKAAARLAAAAGKEDSHGE